MRDPAQLGEPAYMLNDITVMRKRLIIFVTLITVVLSACAFMPGTPTPLPTPTPTLAPNELAKAFGTKPYLSSKLTLDSETSLTITWTQSSKGLFAIWFIYDGKPNLANPALYRTLVENTTQPTQGSKTYLIPAGDWLLHVEQANGPWSVVVTKTK